MTDVIKNYSDPQVAFISEVPVRWSDMDVYQHVNHARTVTLLEEARVAFIASDPDLTRMLSIGVVVADLNVKYKGQIRHADSPLRISMWISHLRSSDFILEYRVRLNGEPDDVRPAVIASTRMVAFDFTNQCVRRFNDQEAQVLHRYVEEQA